MADDQSEVIAFLSDPASHGGADVERIDTHCAHVFLAGDTAWKIKRAVKYDYLDFSTLEKRRTILERELSLNAPAAPSLYRRVVPITRGADGPLRFNIDGEVIEYALEMRRFDAEAQLDRVAEAGGLTDALAEDLGAAIADYHLNAEVRLESGAVLIREIVEELARVFADMHLSLGSEPIAEFEENALLLHRRLTPLLARRSTEGHVRRCHSDLHLANLVMLDGRPVPFDALEFDERLGTCDTFYDIAFLIMDLLHKGHPRAANLCLNSYLFRTRDYAALAALPLFLAIRAAIRAMVDVQTATATGSDATVAAARGYLADALGFMRPAGPRLVAVGGVSGSGKTTLSRLVAPEIGAAPGAVHLRSDLERKALLGVDPLTRLGAEAYSDEVTKAVYARLLAHARAALGAGHSALLDATFLDDGVRREIDALASDLGVPLSAVWLNAPDATLIDRVTTRRGDASDATGPVVRSQLSRASPPTDWTVIDAGGDIADGAARLRTALGLELSGVK